MKDSIRARSEKGGVTVESTSLAPPKWSTIAVESPKVSLAVGIAPEVGAVVEASPRYLFKVPVLGSTLFIWAYCCLRKVAPIGAIMWTNSKGEKSNNPRNLKILYMYIGKNNFWPLLVLLKISTMVWINIEGKHIEPSVMSA